MEVDKEAIVKMEEDDVVWRSLLETHGGDHIEHLQLEHDKYKFSGKENFKSKKAQRR